MRTQPDWRSDIQQGVSALSREQAQSFYDSIHLQVQNRGTQRGRKDCPCWSREADGNASGGHRASSRGEEML